MTNQTFDILKDSQMEQKSFLVLVTGTHSNCEEDLKGAPGRHQYWHWPHVGLHQQNFHTNELPIFVSALHYNLKPKNDEIISKGFQRIILVSKPKYIN